MMKNEGLEYLLSTMPDEVNKGGVLRFLPLALDFVRERDSEFTTADVQKCLKVGFGSTVKLIDAMLALCVIEITEERPRKYKRLCDKNEIQHNVYYNGCVHEADNELNSGWDPALFRTKEDCLAYLKAHYGDDFSDPIYVIETVKVGDGWEVIDRERIDAAYGI